MNNALTFLLAAVLLVIAVHVQSQPIQLVKKQSFPGRPGGVSAITGNDGVQTGGVEYELLDLDNDGVSDLSTFKSNGNDNYQSLKVRGSADGTEYQFPLDGINADPNKLRLVGFYNVFPQGMGKRSQVQPKVAVLALRDEAHEDKVKWTLIRASNPCCSKSAVSQNGAESYRLLGIHDFDGDGLADFLVDDPENKVVEIWGAQE